MSQRTREREKETALRVWRHQVCPPYMWDTSSGTNCFKLSRIGVIW